MILLADSGSTKCDWLVLNRDWEIINHLSTMGLNPYFHNELVIADTLKKIKTLNELKSKINWVFFYGAGCSSEYYNAIMHQGIKNVFSNAEVNVNHDLTACALASYKDEPIISCILGTGSNSCFYDGKTLTSGNPSLGFILGDEASGNYFGKILLNDYFYNRLPKKIHKEFSDEYNLSHPEFTHSVYNNKSANVFLASFMKFISERKDYPYFQKMIVEGFQVFLEKHVCCFENYKNYKTHFIGSIGFYFQDELEKVAQEMDIQIGGFIQKPIFNLINYHKENTPQLVKNHN